MEPVEWQKLGLVFAPDGSRPWMRTHAANPFALPLGTDRFRIYFSCRDESQRSHLGWVEIELADPPSVLRTAGAPALAPGPLGFFDDHGVYGTSVVEHDGRLLLYYAGWNPGPPPMFYPSIGLAESDDGGLTFTRVSRAPIVARSEHDPWMVSAPVVRLEEDRWRMWYLSGIGWEKRGGQLASSYDVKYAESADGVHWTREGHVALALQEGESNIARPCVLRRSDAYEAWFSVDAGSGYRLGFATSADGLTWSRDDARAGLTPSRQGWDSDALAYPWVIDQGDRRWIIYNGGGFGREGFGIAMSASAGA